MHGCIVLQTLRQRTSCVLVWFPFAICCSCRLCCCFRSPLHHVIWQEWAVVHAWCNLWSKSLVDDCIVVWRFRVQIVGILPEDTTELLSRLAEVTASTIHEHGRSLQMATYTVHTLWNLIRALLLRWSLLFWLATGSTGARDCTSQALLVWIHSVVIISCWKRCFSIVC